MVCKYILKVSDFELYLSKFVNDLLSFKTCQSAQCHLCYMVSLNICKTKAAAEPFLSLGNVLRGFHYLDYLVDIIKCDNKSLQYMLTLFCLFKVKPCSSLDNIYLKVDILLKHFFQSKYLRNAVYKCQHDNADSILKLSIAEQLIEHKLGICILFELDNYSHSVLACFITQVVNTLYSLLFDKIGNSNAEPCLIYHIWYLGNDDAVSALYLLYRGL